MLFLKRRVRERRAIVPFPSAGTSISEPRSGLHHRADAQLIIPFTGGVLSADSVSRAGWLCNLASTSMAESSRQGCLAQGRRRKVA